MDMAHAYNEIEIADVSGAKAKLEELIARDLASSEEFNINLDDEYLEIEVYAPVDIIDNVEECLTELAPFIKEGETFTIYVDIEDGIDEIYY